MEPLLEAAEAGYIILYWSPAIIAEASKVLLWIWLQKRGRQMTDGLKREAFDVARRWFDRMTLVFHVVEDRPPYAPQWTDTPQDADDRPVWTAAVNARAGIVITANLKDGPPLDEDGIRTWNNTMYFDPPTFIHALSRVIQEVETNDAPHPGSEAGTNIQHGSAQGAIEQMPEAIFRFLRQIEARAAAELPPAERPE